MPLPIFFNPERPNEGNHGGIDVSFLQGVPVSDKLTKTSWRYLVSDQDASLLMRVWIYGKPEKDALCVDETVLSSRDFYRLKTNNLVFGDKNKISLTERGKEVIKTMALGEENAFAKNKKQKSYHEILANSNKKGKRGYRVAQNTLIDLSKIK